MKTKLLAGTLAIVLVTGCSSKQEQVNPPKTVDDIVHLELSEVIPPVPIAQPDPSELDPIWELSDYERWVVECIVMGEASGESWDGKVLVAQCILNACLRHNIQPSEVRVKYKYSGWNENPNNEEMTAVKAVFDNGHKVTDEPILYFYAPKYSKGKFHETQCYVITEGGHKFFKEWEDWS